MFRKNNSFLFECQACQASISKKVKFCPCCGEKNTLRQTTTTASVVTFLLIIFFGYLFSTPDQSQNQLAPLTPSEIAEKKQFELRFQKALSGALTLKHFARNPDSFALSYVKVIKDTNAICYEFRAQNGFGGINLENAVISKDGATMKTSSMDGFTQLWDAECARNIYLDSNIDYTSLIKIGIKYEE